LAEFLTLSGLQYYTEQLLANLPTIEMPSNVMTTSNWIPTTDSWQNQPMTYIDFSRYSTYLMLWQHHTKADGTKGEHNVSIGIPTLPTAGNNCGIMSSQMYKDHVDTVALAASNAAGIASLETAVAAKVNSTIASHLLTGFTAELDGTDLLLTVGAVATADGTASSTPLTVDLSSLAAPENVITTTNWIPYDADVSLQPVVGGTFYSTADRCYLYFSRKGLNGTSYPPTSGPEMYIASSAKTGVITAAMFTKYEGYATALATAFGTGGTYTPPDSGPLAGMTVTAALAYISANGMFYPPPAPDT